MKRDLDLVRLILLRLEAAAVGEKLTSPMSFDGYDDAFVEEHVRLMSDAGLIDARIHALFGGRSLFAIDRVTWNGYDYLDAVRPESIWLQVKRTARDKSISLTFEIAKALAVQLAKTAVGLAPP